MTIPCSLIMGDEALRNTPGKCTVSLHIRYIQLNDTWVFFHCLTNADIL